jgi:hypothetical protein
LVELGEEVQTMRRKWIMPVAAAFVVLLGVSVPAQAHGFRFSFGVGIGFGGGYYHPYSWYGPAYYPRAYYVRHAYVPYPPVTVVRQYYPYRVYRTHPPRRGNYDRDYGRYVPRPYVRRIVY